MQSDNFGDLWILQAAVGDHVFRSADGFFSRLEEEFDGSRKLIFQFLQQNTGSEQDGGVHIVTACVHDSAFF